MKCSSTGNGGEGKIGGQEIRIMMEMEWNDKKMRKMKRKKKRIQRGHRIEPEIKAVKEQKNPKRRMRRRIKRCIFCEGVKRRTQVLRTLSRGND